MARASLTRRFADDCFVLPIGAIAADGTARLTGRIEFAAADAGFVAGAVAVHAANRTA